MHDKLIVVTGAAGGIGSVISRRAVAEGYRVAAWDVSEEVLTGAADSFGEAPIMAVVDVTDESSVKAAINSLPETPALLVNVAGASIGGTLYDFSVDDFRLMLEVNVTGTFICARQAALRMRDDGGGAIVNIASLAGISPVKNAGSYSASKAGVMRLTEQMAVEWGPSGIRVNAVAPGLIMAGMSLRVPPSPELTERRNKMIPLNRGGTAEDIAGAVMFLMSDDASYITGETILVDGGLTRTAVTSLPTQFD